MNVNGTTERKIIVGRMIYWWFKSTSNCMRWWHSNSLIKYVQEKKFSACCSLRMNESCRFAIHVQNYRRRQSQRQVRIVSCGLYLLLAADSATTTTTVLRVWHQTRSEQVSGCAKIHGHTFKEGSRTQEWGVCNENRSRIDSHVTKTHKPSYSGVAVCFAGSVRLVARVRFVEQKLRSLEQQ